MHISNQQQNQQKSFYYLHKTLSRATESERLSTPAVWIVSQGLQIIQEYKNLLGEWHRDEMKKTEEYVQLIEKLCVLGEKLILLKEYRIDTRNVKEENNKNFQEYVQAYKQEYTEKQDPLLKYFMSLKNIDIEWLNEDDIYIQNDIQNDIEDYIEITQLYAMESDFDVVPKYGLELHNIRQLLTWLDKFWRYPIRNSQTQTIINHCLQIIVGVGNVLKDSIPTPAQRKEIYKKMEKKTHWESDYLLHLCVQLKCWVEEWTMGCTPLISDSYKQANDWQPATYTYWNMTGIIWEILCLHQNGNMIWENPCLDKKFDKFQSWQKRQQQVYQCYPILTQSFANPLEYFSSTYYYDIFSWLMFANVPNTVIYQQMLKIRTQIKELKNILDQIEGIGEWDRLKVITYAQAWSNINNPRLSKYHNSTKQKLKKNNYNIHNENLVLENPLFQQLCAKYLEIVGQPFELLEELFHQAREKRAKILGLGHQIGEMNYTNSITVYPARW